MVALADHAHDGRAADAWLSRLDNLLPAASITTNQYAEKKRLIPGPTRDPVRWSAQKTPYVIGPQDAADIPGVRIVAIQSAARWGKTIIFENKALKHWTYGPSYNVIWYMQTKDDLSDYIDERVTWMLEHHEEVNAKIDWQDPKNGRFRMEIGTSLCLWRPATIKTTRGKAAPIIFVDEIDACDKRVRNGILTLVFNRQREFGANAIALIASHPDAGAAGIAGIIANGLKHLWWWQCPQCRQSSSPCKDAEHRMTWNVPQLLELSEDMDRQELLDMIERDAVLVCPHCTYPVTEAERLPMSNAGHWLQPHQVLEEDGTVTGDPKVAEIMGFVGHGLMSPFVNLGKLARAWAAAKLTADTTGDDIALREETVKSLGEEYEGASADEKMESWKVVKARILSPYNVKTVPEGVMFLTAFVDVQGDRFEVRVIGWDLVNQSWLIDAYALKAWPGFENISPGGRLRDWDIIEDAVVRQVYVTAATAKKKIPLYMPIAKTIVNAAGVPGVSTNARRWLANLVDPKRWDRMAREGDPSRPARHPIESYKVQLYIGSASKKSELFGRPKPVLHDDTGKQLPVQIYERAINVHEVKRIIAARMKVEPDGAPGRMHVPIDISDRYLIELTSERLINGDWIPHGRNETWDGWVACEAARALLQPNRPGLWVKTPVWAAAKPKGQHNVDGGKRLSYYDRLADINRDE